MKVLLLQILQKLKATSWSVCIFEQQEAMRMRLLEKPVAVVLINLVIVFCHFVKVR